MLGRKSRLTGIGRTLTFFGTPVVQRDEPVHPAVEYNGRVYNVPETLESEARLTYFFVSATCGSHCAWRPPSRVADRSGLSRRVGRVVLGEHGRGGHPGRGFLFRRAIDVDGDVQGMSLGYGHYVQGGTSVGVSWRRIVVRAVPRERVVWRRASVRGSRFLDRLAKRRVMGYTVFQNLPVVRP